jgi:hypothetical protein
VFHHFLNQLCDSTSTSFWHIVDYLLNVSYQTTRQINLIRAGKIPEVSRPRARREKYQERRALKLMHANPAARDSDLLEGFDFHCETFTKAKKPERLGLELTDGW